MSKCPSPFQTAWPFDAVGDLYISCYRPDRIYRLTPDDDLSVLADDWQGTVLSAPTNLAFGGPDLRDLLIASLAAGTSAACACPSPATRCTIRA